MQPAAEREVRAGSFITPADVAWVVVFTAPASLLSPTEPSFSCRACHSKPPFRLLLPSAGRLPVADSPTCQACPLSLPAFQLLSCAGASLTHCSFLSYSLFLGVCSFYAWMWILADTHGGRSTMLNQNLQRILITRGGAYVTMPGEV